MLDIEDVEPYLRDRGLLSARAVVDGGLRVSDHSRLNRVFLATAEGERGLVVKVAADPGSAGVAREAAMLERLWSGGGGDLARFLPPVVGWDPAAGVLILEMAPGARDLAEHHARGRFSRLLAGQAGRALASLHEIGPEVGKDLPGRVDPTRIVRVHQPDLEELHGMSAAAIEFISIIQSSDELCAALDELRASWKAGSIIHGDVRWDNCVALRGPDQDHWTRLQLIDWELAAPGDPALDIGALIGDYLHGWLQSIPIVDARDPGRLLKHAAMPLRRIRPALRAFWKAYSQHRRCTAAELSETLRRATGFAAARLLVAGLEEAQLLAELRLSVLNLVPLSENVVMRPDEASSRLLGLGASLEAA